MQEFIVSVMNHYGYAGVFMLILAENLFPPIPSEVILPFSGFMTTYTNMTVWGVVFFSTIGSTLGALILYGIGTLLCMSRLEKIMDSRVCRILGFQKEKIKKTMGWFEKKGMAAVLLGRCVPMIRSLISIPAGMAKMKILTSLGAALGASWGYIQEWISAYSEMTGTVLKIVFFAWIGWKLIRNLLKRRS